jgi:hypothetical protein
MLQHTSGLRDWSTIAGIAGWPRSIFGQGDAHVLDTPYAHGQVRILDVLSRQRSLNFPPGSRWLYSNSGYVLAALIVSRVSGTSFAEFTKRRIFDPLGMKDTSWQQDHTRIVPRRATGYAQYVGGFRTDAPLVVVDGGGGLLTTVDDLLAWNENFTRLTVGDAAMMAAMHQRAPLGDGRTHEYALGLVADTYKGVPEVDHSGGTQGFRAHLARYPDQRVSIAVLCNVTTANPTAYAKALADVLLATSLRPPAPPAAPSYTLTRDAAEPLAGLYRRSPEVGATRILPDANGLSFESGRRLTPTAPGRFVTSDGALTIEFDRPGRFRAWDEFGIVDVYDRVEPAAPTSDQLKAFAGTYVADEVDAAFTVVLDGKQLSMRRRPDTTIPLTAAFADGFATPIGFVVFERDAAGRVSGFTLTHARVWNLRFIRSDAPPRP